MSTFASLIGLYCSTYKMILYLCYRNSRCTQFFGYSDYSCVFKYKYETLYIMTLKNFHILRLVCFPSTHSLHLSRQPFIVKIDILKKQIFSTTFPARISNILKYFLSETIHAQENGSRGTHFAKSLNSNFLKGLTYSALWLP